MKARGVFYYGKFVVMGVAFFALFTYVFMLLWNWLLPELFNGPVINYWQTLGLLLLSKILFTGLGSRHRNGSFRSHSSWRHDKYKSHWKKKFEEKMNERCGPQTNAESSTGPESQSPADQTI